ncbi:AMP-binding protein [Comamonas aquatica]|uniref:AMP-binding protein n=1 Tax=Comamonas aquatica TaxID=225991 RepID=UPI0028D3D814|nr:AMP-binding protein [Comamonas aquatica]
MSIAVESNLAYWSKDVSRPVLEVTTGEALRISAMRFPSRTALVEVVPTGIGSFSGATSTSRRWTYQELLESAERCANWLLTKFTQGDRICVWAPNIPEWVILQYGAAMAGLVLVTANPALKASELSYVLKQSKAAGIFYTSQFRSVNMDEVVESVAESSTFKFRFDEWQSEVDCFSGKNALPSVLPSDPAQIQYTSGTTGQPKGALLHHRGLVTNAFLVSERAGINGSVVISPMPLFHTAGSVLSSLGCIVSGSTYVLPLLFEPELVMGAIEREKCAAIFGVPTMQLAMLEHPKRVSFDLSSLVVAISGGAPVPPELLRRIEEGFHCDLLNVYGQTECSPIICQTSPSDSLEDKANTVGRPLPQAEVRIASDSGASCALGQEGEIQVRGYQCMLGYFELPAATTAAFTAEGWLRTGDLGVMDDRGYVKVTGRLKDMIIRGGENIYPVELESRLMEHPSLVQAVVFGQKDDRWGEVVSAAIQLRAGAPMLTVEELREFCKTRMAPHKIPSRWFIADSFPMTGSGKIQKFRMQEFKDFGALKELVPIS